MNAQNDPRGRETAEYIGDWRSNVRHGQGTMIWHSDGSRFDGIWHMDRRVQGTLLMGSSSGCGASSYTGDFRDDLFHGKGKLVLSESNLGVIYEGVFEEGRCAKFGRLTYSDGSTYLGEMQDFKRDGAGILMKPSGDRYEGEFQNDSATGIC